MRPIALREQTAGRLLRQLNQIPGGGAGGRGAGAGGYGVVLVRCTDDEPAAGSGVGAECYPGVVVREKAGLELADQEDAGAVWLTALAGTVAAEPVVDGLYWCQLAGPVEIGDATRPRAFGTGPIAEQIFSVLDSQDDDFPSESSVQSDVLATVGPGTYLVLANATARFSSTTGVGSGGVVRMSTTLHHFPTGTTSSATVVCDPGDVVWGRIADESAILSPVTMAGIAVVTEVVDFRVRLNVDLASTVEGEFFLHVKPFFAYRLAGAPTATGGGLTGTFGG